MIRGTCNIDTLLQYGVDLGLKSYSVYSEEAREEINNALIEYYRFRDIGFDNHNMFINRLNVAMDRIMRARYNRMLKVLQQEFNPLFNIDITETYRGTNDGKFDNKTTSENTSEYKSNGGSENTGTETNTSKSKGTNSNFPSESMLESDTENYGYIDNLQRGSGENRSANTSNSTSNESGDSKTTLTNNNNGNTISNVKYEKKTQGSSAGLPFSKAMEQYKDFNDRVANIIEQIIHDPAISSLFLNVW